MSRNLSLNLNRMTRRRRKRGRWPIILLSLFAIALLAVAIVKGRGNSNKSTQVTAEGVAKRTITELVSASGKIYPEFEVKISSDVSGEIVNLYVEEGDTVKAGQLLVKVAPDQYESAVERVVASKNASEAQLANTRSQITQLEANKKQAIAGRDQILAQIESSRSAHKRNEMLHKEGVISDAELESTLSALRSLEANLSSASASIEAADANITSSAESIRAAEFQVQSADATVREARENLRKTTIYAPASGVISKLNVEQGERVVGTLQMSGTEIMRIANMDVMEVQVDVSENDILRVSMGDTADVEVDAYLDRTFTGLVTEIASSASGGLTGQLTADQVTNFQVNIRLLPDSYKDLLKSGRSAFRPGMSASVDIRTLKEDDILTVPLLAVATREDEDAKDKDDADLLEVVFISSGDTTVMREIKTGIQDDTYIQVLEGLAIGDTIVTGPYKAVSSDLKEGEKIKVVSKEELRKKSKKK